ncbi:MAG TPA: tetratricopeptide repeat protein [Kofleriaceae bacterium]|nr:tetratricopeptide repeat protein [Kofleriaceae bacterium]
MGDVCSMCGVPVAGASILYTPDGRIVCPACFGKVPMPTGSKPQWKIFAGAGAVAGVIPFGVHMSSSSYSTVNGHVTSFVYRDWVAVVCGVVAIMLGIIATAAARKEQLQRSLAFAAGIGVVLLGGVQIARGFGVFEAPGSSGDSSSSSMTFETHGPAIPEAKATEPDKPAFDPKKPETCPEVQACFDLGHSLEDKDPAAALKAYEHGCSMGGHGSCFNRGFILEHAKEPDYDTALKMFQKVCDDATDAQDGDGCIEIAMIAINVKKDDALAVSMFEKACGLGAALGCSNLGIMYRDGQGVKKDIAKSRELLEKGCEGGSSRGCTVLGAMYSDGVGVKADAKKARELWEKGCAGKMKESCYDLATARLKGKGGPKDKAGAKEAYQAACDLGDDDGCKEAAKIK